MQALLSLVLELYTRKKFIVNCAGNLGIRVALRVARELLLCCVQTFAIFALTLYFQVNYVDTHWAGLPLLV